MLDVDCSYMTFADGTLRCAPSSTNAGSTYFTDAACSQRIIAWQATCAPAVPEKYAIYTNTAGSCPAPEVLELGVAAAPATTYQLNGASCTAYAGPALTYRSVTRTVPPTELVSATVAREPRGTRLFATFYDGADGSRQPLGIEDSAPHAGPCDEVKLGDGALRCAPTKLAFIEGLFSDVGCTTPAAYHPGYSSDRCMKEPLAILESANGTCAGTYQAKYYDVGAKVGDTAYQGSPASCMVAPSQGPGSGFYAKGALIADTAFAVLSHAPSATAPLAVDTTKVETGELLHATSFWDPARNARCDGRKAADGKTRCMGRTIDSPTFADAACMQPLAVVYHAAVGCTNPVPTYIWTDQPDVNNCGAGTVRGFPVGAKVTPAQIYVGSSCSPTAPDTVNADYYATTAELAPSEFVEVTEVTE